MPGQEIFVEPPDVPGSHTGDGSESNPFRSVQDALEAARDLGGAVVRLRAGHYVESTNLEHFEVPGGEIVVQPDDDTGAEVFIDACLPEFLFPQTAEDHWDHVGAGVADVGEYVWRRRYDPVGTGVNADETGRVRTGALLGEPRHTRLVSYDRYEDLVADNEFWPEDPTAGNRVWQVHPQHTEDPKRYIPERRDRTEHPWYRPWVYMGPGIWFDRVSRQVHIRLSPTHTGIRPRHDFHSVSTDPNLARLALSIEESQAVRLKNCHHVKFVGLTLRFGSPATVRINSCEDITFERCRIRSGSRAISFATDSGPTQGVTITDCEIDGGLPTWFFRSDRKDEYIFGADVFGTEEVADQAALDQLLADGVEESEGIAFNQLGFSTSGVLVSGTGDNRGVVVQNCEIYNGHDLYLFGAGTRFHHNWVHNLNDDGIALSERGNAEDVEIFCNVMTQCLTGLSFAGDRVKTVHIYGNLFDLRSPTVGRRPEASGDHNVMRQGQFFKNGGDEGEINMFHNTCLVLDPGARGDTGGVNDVGFTYYSGLAKSDARSAYNNIFVAAYTDDPPHPIAVLAPLSFECEAAGNMFFRVPTGDLDNFMVRRRAETEEEEDEIRSFKDLAEFWETYWPGQPTDGPPVHERSSLLKNRWSFNPWFKSFDTATGRPRRGDDLRLWKFLLWKSPGKGTAVGIPDALEDKYVAATGSLPADRGCYPPTDNPLRVGVGRRRVFPSPVSDLEPDTHADDGWPLAPIS